MYLNSARKTLGRKFNILKCLFFENKYKFKVKRLNLAKWFTQNARILIRIFLVTFTLLSALFLDCYIDFNNIDYSSLSNWLVAVGAMIGGILAIVFSLVNFLQQSSEDLQATMFYDKYIHGTKEKVIFIVTALNGVSIVILGAVFSQSNVNINLARFAVAITVMSTGLVVTLLDYLHELTSKKVNPKNAIDYLQEKSLNILDQIEADASELAGIMKLKSPDSGDKLTEAVALGHIHRTNFNLFSGHIVDLLEISSSLASKNKISAGNRSIEAIEKIILRYLKMRNNNSIISLSDYGLFAFESDSQGFLTTVLEGINRLTKYLLKNDQEAQLVKLVSLYEQIATYSTGIKYVNESPMGANPIATLITGYFKYFIEEAKKYNQLEVLFQSSKSLNNIGIQATKSRDSALLRTIVDQLQVLNMWSIKRNQLVVFDSTMQAWINIFYSLHYSTLTRFKQHGDTILEYMFYSINLVQNLKISSTYFHSLVSIFTDWLRTKLAVIFSTQLQNSYDHPEILLQSLEEMRRVLRSYADNTTDNNIDLFGIVGDFLTFVADFIVRWINVEQDGGIVEDLKSQLTWFAHLPPWFVNNKSKIKLEDVDDLLDASTFVGVNSAITLDEEELMENSVSAIQSILTKLVAKENPSLGFDEPRAALRLSYMGIVALKKKYFAIFEKIKSYLLDFDEKYQDKHIEFLNKVSGLNDIQILIELWRWRDDFRKGMNRKNSFFDPLKDILTQYIEVEDIDRFVFEVWGACDDTCSLKEDHKKQMQEGRKTVEIRSLISVLKLILEGKKLVNTKK